MLLVSPAFLASTYIRNSELPVLLKNAKDHGVIIIPVILRPCLFKETFFKYPNPHNGPEQLSLSVLQSANSPEQALNALKEAEQDQVLLAVAQRLLKLAESSPLKSKDQCSSNFKTTPGEMLGSIPRRNPFFTGREEIFPALKEALLTEQTVVISGLGGLGKTEAAAEFVHRHVRAYEWIFWIVAESHETLVADMSAIGAHLHLPDGGGRDQMDMVRQVVHWWNTHDRWLLVFDNADDFTVLPPFLPTTRNGHVLVTSRAHATGHLGPCVSLQPLTPHQGAVLLLRRAKLLGREEPLDAITEPTRSDAMHIAEILGGLPLALDQAGAFIEETPSTPAKYLSLYQTERARLLTQRGGHDMRHPSVFVTFSLGYEKAVRLHPAAEALLRLSAFLAPDGIPEDLFIEGASSLDEPLRSVVQQPLEFTTLLREVGRFSLIHRDAQGESFSIHRLVQSVIQDMLDEQTQRECVIKAISLVQAAFPRIKVATWIRCQQLLPHAISCTNVIARFATETKVAGTLLNQTAMYLSKRGRYTQAEPLFQRALALRERVLGAEHPNTASSLNNLAELYQQQGRYAEAEPLSQRVLALCERVLGPEHPNTASSLNNLAALYHRQGRYTEAEPLYQRALAIRERVLGPEHPDTAVVARNLAKLYLENGEEPKAIELLARYSKEVR